MKRFLRCDPMCVFFVRAIPLFPLFRNTRLHGARSQGKENE